MLNFIFYLFKVLIRICLNLFFREVKVRGLHNVSSEDPILFIVAPHANQFIDPLILTISAGRNVGFLAAKKSMDKLVIGFFGRLLNSIPVERPQDLAKKEPGTIFVDKENPLKIHGIGTRFLAFKPKTALVLPKDCGSAFIESAQSDTELTLAKPFTGDIPLTMLTIANDAGQIIGTTFKSLPHVDQSIMFEAVTSRLSKNNCVGIFPEGGSHDRSEMLPLKAGAAIMALETLVKFPGTRLKIIPTGLHYFHGDKFRSRAVIEFGEPIELPIELVDQYKKGGADKRQAIGLLLDTIFIRLQGLTLQAPTYEQLMVCQVCRRLYQSELLDADASLTITRRFAHALDKLKDQPDVIEFTRQVMKYNRMLKFYGVADHQVKNTYLNARTAMFLTLSRCLEVIFLVALCTPTMILFSPLFFLTAKVSAEKAKEALAGSTVKIAGKDVIATWKLLTALIVVPLLWFFYTFCTFTYFYIYFGFQTAFYAALFFFLTLPFIGHATIRLSDLAFDVIKSIRPLIVAMGNVMSSSEPLRDLRAELQKKVRDLVDQLGPEVFADFEQIRVLTDEDFSQWDGISAQKLGRSKNMKKIGGRGGLDMEGDLLQGSNIDRILL